MTLWFYPTLSTLLVVASIFYAFKEIRFRRYACLILAAPEYYMSFVVLDAVTSVALFVCGAFCPAIVLALSAFMNLWLVYDDSGRLYDYYYHLSSSAALVATMTVAFPPPLILRR